MRDQVRLRSQKEAEEEDGRGKKRVGIALRDHVRRFENAKFQSSFSPDLEVLVAARSRGRGLLPLRVHPDSKPHTISV